MFIKRSEGKIVNIVEASEAVLNPEEFLKKEAEKEEEAKKDSNNPELIKK